MAVKVGNSWVSEAALSYARDNNKRIYEVAENQENTPQTPMFAGFLFVSKKI